MQAENKSNIEPVAPSEISRYADISHKKGDIKMFTLSEDKIDALLSNSSSLSANFLCLVLGALVGVITAIYSGGIQDDMKPFFKIALLFGSILALFFLIYTIKDELQKRKLKNNIKNFQTN